MTDIELTVSTTEDIDLQFDENFVIQGSSVEVIDNLNSTSATSALSANQGRVLKGLIPTKTSDLTNDSNFSHTDNNYTNTDKAKVDTIPTLASTIDDIGERGYYSQNLWNEQYLFGYHSVTTGTYTQNNLQLTTTDLIPIVPTKTIYIKGATNVTCVWFGQNKNALGRYATVSNSVVVPSDAHYMHINFGTTYGITYNHDIMVSYFDCAYTPYVPSNSALQSGKVDKTWKSFSARYGTNSGWDYIPSGASDGYMIVQYVKDGNILMSKWDIPITYLQTDNINTSHRVTIPIGRPLNLYAEILVSAGNDGKVGASLRMIGNSSGEISSDTTNMKSQVFYR